MNAPIAHSIKGAAEASNTGRTKIYEAIGTGELKAKKLGRRTLILDDDLRAWLNNMPPYKPSRPGASS